MTSLRKVCGLCARFEDWLEKGSSLQQRMEKAKGYAKRIENLSRKIDRNTIKVEIHRGEISLKMMLFSHLIIFKAF